MTSSGEVFLLNYLLKAHPKHRFRKPNETKIENIMMKA